MKRKIIWLLLLLVGVSLISLVVGVHSLPMQDLFHLDKMQQLILWQTRVPRTISLVIAGATLSVCGLIMQQLTQNKFVSPSIAGTMDSARLGILIAMIVFPTAASLTKSLVAFFFAFLGTLFFVQLLHRLPRKNQVLVPLVGVMYGNIIGSAVTFIAYQLNLIQNMSAWLQGNFAVVTKGSYELIYLSIPLLLISYFYAHHFTVAGMGQDLAVGVGLNYQWIQLIGLGIVGLASSTILVTIGSLPFIGVVIPNLVSLRYGDQVHRTLGITALFGSVFLIICDILSRIIIAPYEIPVSLTVGVIGSALFLYLLLRGNRR